MKKETQEQWLEKRNAEAIASVPAQDVATKKVETEIKEQRKAIASAEKERLQNKKSKRV